MTPFHDLYLSHRELSPARQQAAVEHEFPALVAQGPLHWSSPDQPVCGGTPQRLLIGVATYSEEDMRLLDEVEAAVRKESSARSVEPVGPRSGKTAAGARGMIKPLQERLRVEVFSVLACKTQEEFDRYIPGIGKVYQTPVVGFWVDGLLREKCSGAPARALVRRVCGLDSL